MRAIVIAASALFLVSQIARAEGNPLPPLPPPSEATPQLPQQPSRAPTSVVGGCDEPYSPYCHDGFYMRLGFGIAHTSAWGSGPQGNASISGTGAALSAAVGGTIAHTLVVGGAVRVANGAGDFTGAPPAAQGNATASLAQVLGIFADWFPVPTRGWHLGSQVGLGMIGITDASSNKSSSLAFTASVFGGYDWWIGPQWSLGMLMSLSTATPEQMVDASGERYSLEPLAFDVEASVLWH